MLQGLDTVFPKEMYLNTILPPVLQAYNQLKRAVRAPPTCKFPVGEGAKRTRTCTTNPVRPSIFPRQELCQPVLKVRCPTSVFGAFEAASDVVLGLSTAATAEH